MSRNGDLLLQEPFSFLTCWDSLAAAAASPVSMEATLVPSRTGLSCLGTDGPTLAVEDRGKANQSAREVVAHSSQTTSGSGGP